MLLAPRQLQRHGMTGAVPYYGGRLTPAHIYGIQQQARQGRPPGAPPPAPPPAAAPPRNQGAPNGVIDALTYLRDTGVITSREFDDLRARAGL